ncbi:MAG TPA: alpha-L-arabinofuranosidase C-terminal domain-containing protein [Candidatus Solibacter sp.]|nr:alpha-L-arabinofuranosidase C-terminal domain-containing protein [Candidatus Solibacter sp.]
MGTNRREFLRTLTSSSAALAAGSWLQPLGYAQARGTARTVINEARHKGDLDRRVLGAFLEHLGRAVYEGVFDPKSPLADANGFRKDVLAEVKGLGVPIMRYPGGNFVSGYNWLDGVGPKAQRPTVLDRAWNTLEPNQFGTNEFIQWAKLVGAEPLLGGNFGTGTVAEQVAYVEYCNVDRGTKWSDLRRSHGYEQPHQVKYWCLGNEMDGPWQMGTMPARDYGRKARDAARQFRVLDPSLQLIACGSSNTILPTYLVWDREVLEECYDQVDAISLHNYYGNTPQLTGGNVSRYLAMNLDMERQIHEIGSVCDYVQGVMKSPKRLWLSFDEWNVWYRARGGVFANGQRKLAPHLLEEQYNLEDALLVGGFLNTLLRQSDRVRVGCLAQIVNVIAPLLTNAEKTIRQTIYYPYAWALKYAHGRVLDLQVVSETYPIRAEGLRADFARNDQVPFLDIVATHNPGNGQVALFMLNRDTSGERELSITWQNLTPTRVLACQTLTGRDLKAANTFEEPNRVAPSNLDAPRAGSTMSFRLPAASYTVAHLG